MKLIKTIEIKNIKGIENKKINLDMIPNKPSILIAPNGYGKSSFATSFNSLKANKLELDIKNRYKNEDNEYSLEIQYQDDKINKTIKANKLINEISNEFGVFVINNQLCSKAKRVNRAIISNIGINNVVIEEKIPDKFEIEYDWKKYKKNLGDKGKLFYNLKEVLKNDENIIFLYEHRKDIEDNIKKRKINKMHCILEKIKEKTLKCNKENMITTLNEELNSEILEVKNIDECKKLILGLKGIKIDNLSNIDVILIILQLDDVYKLNKSNFKKIYKYANYKIEKNEINELFKYFDITWKHIKPKESKKKGYYIEFPNAYEISNGQRDILTFIALLYKSKNKLNKEKNILIIDEVFDYLDDANLICAQYYISKFINQYKKNNKDIYPIILTHLDPLYFNNYTFKDQKLYYLKEQHGYKNDPLLNLLNNRSNKEIGESISKYFLHYHNEDCNLSKQFKELGIDKSINTSFKLRKKSYEELEKYIKGNKYKPLLTFLAIRLKVEEIIFNKLNYENEKEEFIKTFKTKNKLDFAESKGIEIPEVYYLLGIIYNDSMHISKDSKSAERMPYKLDNEVIRTIVSKIE